MEQGTPNNFIKIKMADDVPVAVIVKEKANILGKLLKEHGLYDGDYNIAAIDNKLALPLTKQGSEYLKETCQSEGSFTLKSLEFDLKSLCLKPSKRQHRTLKSGALLKISKEHVHNIGGLWSEVEKEVPNKWEVHGNTALLPPQAFLSSLWNQHGYFEKVAACLNVAQLARKSAITNDDFRSPRVMFLLGCDPWLLHVDNGIKYTYNVTRSMFSSGNISEKLRIAHFDCTNETVVDLYAGIGYFTLPYLVHAGAGVVHACEWNPAAVEALRRNLHLNMCADRCYVHQGDNAKVCPHGIADRVNLGLIPSSEEGWPVACKALRPEGGMLHIHANVTSYTKGLRAKHDQKHKQREARLTAEMRDVLEMEKSKVGKDGDEWKTEKTKVEEDGDEWKTEKTKVEEGGEEWETKRHGGEEQMIQEMNNGLETKPQGEERGEQNIPKNNWETKLKREVRERTIPMDYKDTSNKVESQSQSSENNIHIKWDTNSSGHTIISTHNVIVGMENEKQPKSRILRSEYCHIKSTENTQEPSQLTNKIDLTSHPIHPADTTKNVTKKKATAKSLKFLKTCSIKTEWVEWAEETSERIKSLLERAHPGREWRTEVVHIEHVKSYAPCIDHIVLDLRCKSE